MLMLANDLEARLELVSSALIAYGEHQMHRVCYCLDFTKPGPAWTHALLPTGNAIVESVAAHGMQPNCYPGLIFKARIPGGEFLFTNAWVHDDAMPRRFMLWRSGGATTRRFMRTAPEATRQERHLKDLSEATKRLRDVQTNASRKRKWNVKGLAKKALSGYMYRDMV